MECHDRSACAEADELLGPVRRERELRNNAVLTNRKPDHRRGKIQLIDATSWFEPLRKNLGKKNCELSEADTTRICDTFLAFEETEQSKIFPNAAFGYWKVTVEQPLRLAVDLSPEQRARFRAACREAQEEPLANVVDRVAETLGAGPHLDFNRFMAAIETDISEHGVKLTAKRKKLLQTSLAARDETAEPVIKKIHKPGRIEPDPIRGLVESTVKGKRRVVEYESDTELRDTEQVPLLEEGGIEAFLRREVLPHASDAWSSRTASRPVTRSASPATSTSPSQCALSKRSAPTSWRWRRKPKGCLARSSERMKVRRTLTNNDRVGR